MSPEPTVAAFPTAICSTTSLGGLVANQKTYVVSGAHSASIQTITTTGVISGITAPNYLAVGSTGEIIYFEGISGADFTSCTRGADGTTGAIITSGSVLYHVNVANLRNQQVREMIAIETELINNLFKGWITETATWTYVSAATFTVVGDVTARFGKGTKLKLTQQTTVKYFYVVASSYSAPNTTVTVTGGSDYSLADAAITSPYYSYAATPQGFPGWLAYNCVPVGWAATPTSSARFCIAGRLVTVMFSIVGTSDATTHTMSAPIAGGTSIVAIFQPMRGQDNGGNRTTGMSAIGAATTVTFYSVYLGAAWTASGASEAVGILAYEI